MAELNSTLVEILAESNSGEGPSNPATLRYRFQTPEISRYLSQLTSLSLPDIIHEPSNLAAEASQLTNSLTSLCHSEYPTFLSLHRTSSMLSSTFTSFSSSLSALVSALPALESDASHFTEQSKTIQDARKEARKILSQHDALVDILDIPQLIDTCVRNAYYQEAMDLSAHANRLSQKFPDVVIVQDVAAEAAHAMRLMLAQLLSLLREPAKLPALFKAISFLRKMGAMGEKELALVFLTSRLICLNGAMDSVEKDQVDHARYVRRYVDVWREGVADVIAQFTTIFVERAPSASDSPEHCKELRYLLSALTRHELSNLLQVLRARLQCITDASSLSALLTQLCHCAAALARHGLDFRPLLPPLFEHAIETRFVASMDAAVKAFSTTLSDAKKYNRLPSSVLCVQDAISSPPDDVTFSDVLYVPPQTVTSFPPLATFTNAILAALNSLRLLAPASLVLPLIKSLDVTLAQAAQALLSYIRYAIEESASRRKSFSDDEVTVNQERITRAGGKVYSRLLVPYLRRCLIEGVYSAGPELFEKDADLKDSLTQLDTWLDGTV